MQSPCLEMAATEVDDDESFLYGDSSGGEKPGIPDVSEKIVIKTEPVDSTNEASLDTSNKLDASAGESVTNGIDIKTEENKENKEEKDETANSEDEYDSEEDSDEDEDDNIQVTIGDINTADAPFGGAVGWNLKAGQANATKAGKGMATMVIIKSLVQWKYGLETFSKQIGAAPTGSTKRLDPDAIGTVDGVPIYEYDIDTGTDEKPWRKPGADITDYFNYGFTEDTWKQYCDKQRKLRYELGALKKGFAIVPTAVAAPGKDGPAPEIEVLPDGRTRLKAGPPPDRKPEGTITVIGGDSGSDSRRRRQEELLMAAGYGQPDMHAVFPPRVPFPGRMPLGPPGMFPPMHPPGMRPSFMPPPPVGPPNEPPKSVNPPSSTATAVSSSGGNAPPSGFPPSSEHPVMPDGFPHGMPPPGPGQPGVMPSMPQPGQHPHMHQMGMPGGPPHVGLPHPGMPHIRPPGQPFLRDPALEGHMDPFIPPGGMPPQGMPWDLAPFPEQFQRSPSRSDYESDEERKSHRRSKDSKHREHRDRDRDRDRDRERTRDKDRERRHRDRDRDRDRDRERPRSDKDRSSRRSEKSKERRRKTRVEEGDDEVLPRKKSRSSKQETHDDGHSETNGDTGD